MADEPQEPSRALGRFVVERVVKDDGRYLLLYSWPDSPRGDAGAAPAAEGAVEKGPADV